MRKKDNKQNEVSSQDVRGKQELRRKMKQGWVRLGQRVNGIQFKTEWSREG